MAFIAISIPPGFGLKIRMETAELLHDWNA